MHCPIEAPASYVEPYLQLDPNRQKFAGMLAALDEAVGIVVGAFEKKEMWDNTLTVFSTVSDHTQLRLKLCRSEHPGDSSKHDILSMMLRLLCRTTAARAHFRASLNLSDINLFWGDSGISVCWARCFCRSVGSKDGEHPSGIGCATGSQNWPLRGGKGAYYQGGVRGTAWVHGKMLSPAAAGTHNFGLMHVCRADMLVAAFDCSMANVFY